MRMTWPNQALQRTVAGLVVAPRCISWPVSLSLGRSANSVLACSSGRPVPKPKR
jgi:hypothetical protein